MDWFVMIKRYYDNGLWQKWQVASAVQMNKITPEQYKEIVGEEYTP